MKTRWNSNPEYQNLEFWGGLFKGIKQKCSFLTGDNDGGWVADLEWIVRLRNFAKILRGGFNDRDGAKKMSKSEQRTATTLATMKKFLGED